MALFKSDEQKALEYARKQQQAADKQYQEFLTTPVGQAVRARDEGQGFVEIQLAIGTSRVQGGIHPLGNITATSDTTTTQRPAGTLAGSPWFRVSGDVVLAGHAASRAVA